MHPAPNRMGLGMRSTPSYGQGPPIGSLIQQPPPQPQQKLTTLFVGSISAGITDSVLNSLLNACGSVRSFKRLLTPIGKPQGFGFAEFEEPEALPRAIEVLNGIELPSLEDGAPTKKLLIRADEKTQAFLKSYMAQKIQTDGDEAQMQTARFLVSSLLDSLRNPSSANGGNDSAENDKFIIPPHLHDLQEADLPENQRGLVISEIALFRERAAKREKDKMQSDRDRTAGVGPVNANAHLRGTPPNAPSGPKERVWGKPQQPSTGNATPSKGGASQGWAKTPQGPSKAPTFVKGEEKDQPLGDSKTDEDRDREGRQNKAREDERIFRERERNFEYQERIRIRDIERAIKDERRNQEHQERDRIEMKSRLEVWDDDESDELFYTDRIRWRQRRADALARETASDNASRELEARQAEQLRRESEAFLAKQMDEMKTLAVEQRKAGLLVDDGAPVRLNVSVGLKDRDKTHVDDATAAAAPVFGMDEEEEEDPLRRKRRGPMVKLDFGVASDDPEKIRQRLEKMRAETPKDKESLWKVKVRWDALTDTMIDRKLEPIIKRKMTEYLGELDDDDLIMFVVEHLKDHKSAAKLVEGLEPVLAEEAEEFTIALWRQIVFESLTYGEGLNAGSMTVD